MKSDKQILNQWKVGNVGYVRKGYALNNAVYL